MDNPRHSRTRGGVSRLEERIDVMLAEQKMTHGTFWCVKTDQSCIDESIGGLLYRYLTDDLSAAEQDAVELHLDHCGYCQAAFVNWHSISDAMGRLGHEGRKQDV